MGDIGSRSAGQVTASITATNGRFTAINGRAAGSLPHSSPNYGVKVSSKNGQVFAAPYGRIDGSQGIAE